MSNYNITVKEIIEHLQSLNIKELVIESCKERRNDYTKGDVYNCADRIISNAIYTLVDNDKEEIYCENLGYGNNNVKDRYIYIQYKNNKSHSNISLITISYTINCKKEKKDWKIADIIFKVSLGGIENKIEKSIQQLIDDSLSSIRKGIEDNLNVHLPQHITESQNLFDKVIEMMKNGEDISWDYEYQVKKVVAKYNKLKNQKE